MAKIDHRTLGKERHQSMDKELAGALKLFGMKEEGVSFFRQLLTESERVMVVRRLQIARRLLLGHSFPRIAHDLGVGVSTIRGVHGWLNEQMKDYRAALNPLLQDFDEGRDSPAKLFGKLRKKYPAHFLLISILLNKS
ncbi:MAG TPA: Trp family transcriptional regulator [Candidatus Peribacteraceae bacterium]|nr:Trp family transcriptional regulator [Candidatus Peribacteraceae bacterium]